MNRKCYRCKRTKPVSEFSKREHGIYCALCQTKIDLRVDRLKEQHLLDERKHAKEEEED